MIFSEENKNISKAFSEAWSTIQTPKYNSKVKVSLKSGGSYSFEYTDLTGIFEAVKAVFKEHGLSIMQDSYTENIDGKNYACVETMILHSSGEWVKNRPLKFLASNQMQDFGGQITYMKRYSLSSMLGLSTDKDDDANGASGNGYEYQNKQNNSNYNNSSNYQKGSQQQSKSQQSWKASSSAVKPQSQSQTNVKIPKTAKEAQLLIIPDLFDKHKGKTLGKVWVEDKPYLASMMTHAGTPVAIVEGILLMQQAAAEATAKTKGE